MLHVIKMDSFMDYLTLGMVKYLEKLPCVSNLTVVEKEPVDEAAMTSWQQRNNCLLPSDLRNFYSTTDGLQVKWSLKMKGEAVPCGAIEICSLSKLRRVAPKRPSLHSELPTLLDIESDSEVNGLDSSPPKPKFKDRCKAFVIDSCHGSGKVCLVYLGKLESLRDMKDNSHIIEACPKVWFLDRALEWHYLAPDFTSYFRLSLAYLGIPQWQYVFTPMGPPPRTKQLLQMFVPDKMALH